MAYKHCDCMYYLNLDVEKGMCALTKQFVRLDGEGSETCPNFTEGKLCKFCKNYKDPDQYGIATCVGFETEDWCYAECGASYCENFERA